MTIISPDEAVEPEIQIEEEVAEAAAPAKEAKEQKEEFVELKALPTLQFYQKTYASSCGNNDVKAAKLFREYESRDKIQRLKLELYAVSKNRAAEAVCNRIIGPVRRNKHKGYDNWAFMVLNTLNSKA